MSLKILGLSGRTSHPPGWPRLGGPPSWKIKKLSIGTYWPRRPPPKWRPPWTPSSAATCCSPTSGTRGRSALNMRCPSPRPSRAVPGTYCSPCTPMFSVAAPSERWHLVAAMVENMKAAPKDERPAFPPCSKTATMSVEYNRGEGKNIRCYFFGAGNPSRRIGNNKKQSKQSTTRDRQRPHSPDTWWDTCFTPSLGCPSPPKTINLS